MRSASLVFFLVGCVYHPRLGASVDQSLKYDAPPSITLTVVAPSGVAMQWDAVNDERVPNFVTFSDSTPAETIVGGAMKQDLAQRGIFAGGSPMTCTVERLMHTRRIHGYGWYGSHNHFAGIEMTCNGVKARGYWWSESGPDDDKPTMFKTIGHAIQLAASRAVKATPDAKTVEDARKLVAWNTKHAKRDGLFRLALIGQQDPGMLADKEEDVRAAAVLALTDPKLIQGLAAKIYDEKHIVQWAIIAAARMNDVKLDLARAAGTLGPDAAALLALPSTLATPSRLMHTSIGDAVH